MRRFLDWLSDLEFHGRSIGGKSSGVGKSNSSHSANSEIWFSLGNKYCIINRVYKFYFEPGQNIYSCNHPDLSVDHDRKSNYAVGNTSMLLCCSQDFVPSVTFLPIVHVS